MALVCPALANGFWNDFLSTSQTSFNQSIVDFWQQGEIPVSGTVTLPISLASNRYQQQLFVLKSPEADCFLV